MTYTLYRSQQLNCDINRAWKFFSSPENLSRITPKSMKFKVLSELPDDTIYVGMLIDYKVTPLWGIAMNWKTEITQVEYLKSFTDFQVKGPYSLWRHFHEFIPNQEGVLVKDRVEYKLPYTILGDLAHLLFVKKKLNQIFDYRMQVLENMFNS